MIQQTVNIPDKDYHLFLEVAKKFKWKVQETNKPVVDNFVITDKILAILDESSQTPNDLCISEKDFLKHLDEL